MGSITGTGTEECIQVLHHAPTWHPTSMHATNPIRMLDDFCRKKWRRCPEPDCFHPPYNRTCLQLRWMPATGASAVRIRRDCTKSLIPRRVVDICCSMRC